MASMDSGECWTGEGELGRLSTRAGGCMAKSTRSVAGSIVVVVG